MEETSLDEDGGSSDEDEIHPNDQNNATLSGRKGGTKKMSMKDWTRPVPVETRNRKKYPPPIQQERRRCNQGKRKSDNADKRSSVKQSRQRHGEVPYREQGGRKERGGRWDDNPGHQSYHNDKDDNDDNSSDDDREPQNGMNQVPTNTEMEGYFDGTTRGQKPREQRGGTSLFENGGVLGGTSKSVHSGQQYSAMLGESSMLLGKHQKQGVSSANVEQFVREHLFSWVKIIVDDSMLDFGGNMANWCLDRMHVTKENRFTFWNGHRREIKRAINQRRNNISGDMKKKFLSKDGLVAVVSEKETVARSSSHPVLPHLLCSR